MFYNSFFVEYSYVNESCSPQRQNVGPPKRRSRQGKGHTGNLSSILLLAKKEAPHRENPLRRLTGSPAARAVPVKGQR